MKTPQDISKDPDMIELERMIEAGELDPDRVTKYPRKKPYQPDLNRQSNQNQPWKKADSWGRTS